jgi:hypothetical protein
MYNKGLKLYTSKDVRPPSLEAVLDRISSLDIGTSDWVYNCSNLDFRQIESTICASEKARVKRLKEKHTQFESTSR